MSDVMALKKMLIGHHIENMPEDCAKKVNYVMQGDGVWEIRENALGCFSTQIAKCTIPALESNIEEGWDLNVPKMPFSVLAQVVSFFRKINKIHQAEVFLQIFWSTKEEEYFIHCPKQEVTGASVNYKNDDVIDNPDNIFVFEIHSHNTMSAFFSGTDDGDEKGDRFFGVVGKVNEFFPEVKIRLSIGGRKCSVDIEDIFDIDDETYHKENYPKEWLDQIRKPKVEVRSYRNGTTVFGRSRQLPLPIPFNEDDISEQELSLLENFDDLENYSYQDEAEDEGVPPWRDRFNRPGDFKW